MPFYAIDWRRYADHVEIRTPLDASSLVDEHLGLVLKVFKASGFWMSYVLSRKYHRVQTVHLFVLIFFGVIFFAFTAIAARFVITQVYF